MNRARAQNTNSFDLTNAAVADYDFALRLYLACMKPLLCDLGAWDEGAALARFDAYFRPAEVKIIRIDGQDVGWMQVSETESEINLDQIHLVPAHRCRGIGTRLISDLMAVAARKKKPVMLSLVRGNRARTLYDRLGFEVDNSDPLKIHMRWEG